LSGKGPEPQEVVRRGYDQIARRYEHWSAGGTEVRRWFLSEVVARIAGGGDVLELGCGTGREAFELARGRTYTGVDGSKEMLSVARERLPGERFELDDYTRIKRRPGSLDAVVSFYSFNHVPVDDQWAITARIYGWLRPDGVFCASLTGGGRFEQVEEDWLGVPMYFAGQTRQDDVEMLQTAGFVLELSEIREELEQGHGRVSFHWVIGRKPR
jgi:SAM-dependent methyltransferase